MNKRTLLIIAGFALPPVALAIIIQSGVPSLKIDAPRPAATDAAPAVPTGPIRKGVVSAEPVRLPPLDASASSETGRYPAAASELDNTRERVRHRLAILERMTPADWPAERERNSHAPATLAEALAHNRALIAELDTITPEQWASGQRPLHMGGDFTVPVPVTAPANEAIPAVASTPASTPAAGQ